ncbi:hypothetical protein SS17_0653 [Escherichia coli O157:H7 str. SS17]|nr:hypothetical protein SS17_0653 [Escherichia coli O157:H7 str. SS17]
MSETTSFFFYDYSHRRKRCVILNRCAEIFNLNKRK